MTLTKSLKMNELIATYGNVREEITAAGAALVAVSKTKPASQIMELYELGQRDFGENRVAELVEKHEQLPQDIRWHFIGHLQRNKVKAIAPFVYLIHAVDSERLLREIDKQALANDRQIPVLLQFHIAEEVAKYGLDAEAGKTLLRQLKEQPLTNAYIAGLMGMATYTDKEAQISAEFAQLQTTAKNYLASTFIGDDRFRELSMGMSGDYKIALAHGSTLVRIGSMLFGSR